MTLIPLVAFATLGPFGPDAPAERPLLSDNMAEAFVGLDERALLHRLGPPDFRLAESPGEYWRYSVAPCQLDLFLYPASGGDLSVQHARYRPSQPHLPAEACLRVSAALAQ